MAKKKIQKTNAIRLLEQMKIGYQEAEYPFEEEHIDANTTAKTLGLPAGAIYKTLVTVGNKTGPVVAVIPGNCELDLKSLAKVSGNKKMEMLHLRELESTTGYIRGGCSPIGMKKLFPTFIDEKAQIQTEIHISAGRRGLQMSLQSEDLARATKGQFAKLTLS